MKPCRIPFWAVAAVALVVWHCSTAAAQRRIVVRPPLGPRAADPAILDGEGLDGVFLPPDRIAKRKLDQAREMLQGSPPDYSDSVGYLGALLEGSEDFFFRPDPSQPVYRSLKAEAGRLIAEMPREGQQVYELRFGATARRMLEEAAAAGDIAKISDVSRRFFYTEAGWEATVLVARHHLDHGSPLAGALSLQRLSATPAAAKRLEPMLSLSLAACWARGGMPERAKEVLAQLKKKYPDAQIRRGEGLVRVFSGDGQELAGLVDKGPQQKGRPPQAQQWTMFRGDPGRNAASAGGGPLLSARWQQRVVDDESIRVKIRQSRQSYLDQDVVALPSAHPLAIGDFVVMRRPDSLCGVEFTTGKLKWVYEDGSFKKSPGAYRSDGGLVPAAIRQRTWEDATYGTMSSDGECVYLVDNLYGGGGSPMPKVIMPNGRGRLDLGPKTSNCLVARELARQGALRWYVGTDARGDEGRGAKIGGCLFSWPAAPAAGSSLCLSRNARPGDPPGGAFGAGRPPGMVAAVGGCGSGNARAFAAHRRHDPSFADGVLVCPTSAGAVVAVDLASRSLLWGYQYPKDAQGMDHFNAMPMGRGIDYGVEPRSSERWADATATVVDGRVLLTPIEADSLLCLDLLDGRVHWKQERDNNLYVACVDQGKVIVVGHKRVSAFKLADGTPAWDAIELPPGSTPSGRGYHSGTHYYLPLSTAEVAKLDLATGRIESRAKSRHGEVPGNLICFRGEVISQGVDNLETFYQLESLKEQVAETLKKNPDDPKALAQLGQIKLDEGKLQEAIHLFRRAYELDHTDTSRDLLVDSLLEGLRFDFDGSRQSAEDLESLIDQKQQRTKYLRYMAMGLQRSGETLAAFQTYLKLLDQEPVRAELDEANESLLVRRDRWIQGQLGQLRSAAKPEDQRQIDAVVQARLAAALTVPEGKPQIAALRSFLSLFGSHPGADEAREQLARRLSGHDTLLEREQLLRRLEASPVEQTARRATVRLGVLFEEAGRPEFAAICYRKLLDRWKDEECLDGKTGRQHRGPVGSQEPRAEAARGKKDLAGQREGRPERVAPGWKVPAAAPGRH